MSTSSSQAALRRLTYTLIVGALAVIFDTTIMSVAIDGLAGQLHTSLGTTQWVTTAYLLALSATMPAVGWAQSVLSGKRLWIGGLGMFFIGSLLCAGAWNVQSLAQPRRRRTAARPAPAWTP